jgi:hypothetical protein
MRDAKGRQSNGPSAILFVRTIHPLAISSQSLQVTGDK